MLATSKPRVDQISVSSAGDAVRLLWLELERSLALAAVHRDEPQLRYLGGKTGIMKEWLEGLIHATGLALALIQPALGL
ncbi:MAG TPA: hypothetical protein PKC25_02995 [Candidatus Rifleibacterium sp.]|nr:hypothetical protein [Candidatus Rifleibacterium sp.]